MALSDDQRAMLRLLAQREQGYEDIAALMGLSVDDVRAKVKEALAQLEDEGVAPPPLPPEPTAAPEPEPPAPAPAVAVTPPPASPPRPPAQKKPRDRNMLIAIGGGVAAVVVIVALLVLLLSNSGGDSNSGDTTTAANDASGTAQTVSAAKQPTEATLEAVDGSDASGTALFGRVKNSLALGIEADGLEPTAKGTLYMVWLAQTPQQMLPLTAVAVPQSGRIKAQYEVPTEAVVYLASGDFDHLVITRANRAQLRASLVKANAQKQVPAYTGDAVLEGEVVGPIVGAQARLEARQKEKEAE